MKSALQIAACAIAITVLAGCDNILRPKEAAKAKPQVMEVKGTLIARINNMPITLEELNKEIDTYNAMVPADRPEAKLTTRDQKVNYLKNEMVRRSILYQEAMVRGLERKEDIVQALEKTKQDLMVMDLVRQEAEKVDVSSAEIENYYNDYKEQMREPEERQIREIVVVTEQEARDVLIQLLQGADFAAIAKERSKASSAKDGGDLGFIPKGKKFAQFDTVAFSDTLEVGKVSNIFKGLDGYYIVKLENKRGGKLKTLSEMWDDIKRGLTFLKQQQKIEELISNLSSRTKIDIYEGEIK